MKQLNDFIAFIKKNRVIIYTILGLALILQICSQGAKPPLTDITENQEISIPKGNDLLENMQQDIQEPTPPSQPFDYNGILIMTIAVLGIFVAKRYGLLDKIFPPIVILKVNHYKQRSSGNHVVKILIINKTRKDISFLHPAMIFYKGSKTREFAIKNIGGQNYFPLTLMPNTAHKFTIDAQKFYDKVEGLKEYKTLQVKICSTNGKCYKSIKWPIALTYKRI